MAKDRYMYFRVEAREILEGITRGILAVEQGADLQGALREIQRLAHTLKGAAGVVKLPSIGALAHRLEDVIGSHSGCAALPREAIDRVLELVDAMAGELAGIDAPREAEAVKEAPSGQLPAMVRAELADLDFLMQGLAEAVVQAGALRRVAGDLESVAGSLGSFIECTAPARPRGPLETPAAASRARRIREETKSLGSLRGRLAAGIERLDRELVDLRSRIDRLRLLPASSLFAELERSIRDTARSSGKEVCFAARGGEIRTDAHVLAGIRMALLHLVRNAVVHGIEDPGARKRAGKPERGTVRLSVERRGYCVSFQLNDDGRGIDLEALRLAAVRSGLLPAQESARMGVDEALKLIFEPGVTTTQEADMTSGRGMGLDVVNETASRLKGHVQARSKAGGGLTVEIVVPVSLACLETLRLRQGSFEASLPLSAMYKVLRVSRSDIGFSGGGESIVCDGEAIPYGDLAALVCPPGEQRTKSCPKPEGRTWAAVVIQAEKGRAALGVERLLGTGQEMIKQIPPAAGPAPLLAGASIDAEGKPHLVLDPASVVDALRRGEGSQEAEAAGVKPPILVVDDSLTTRLLEQTILEANGYQVDLATCAEEALCMARKRAYGVMLVDVEMPGMNGFELLEKVRADPELRETPAILMTTRGSPEDRRRGMKAGATAYLLKSEFDEAVLLQAIRGLID
jgi:two-component system chemotaxis sensor kinase CheA